MALVAMLLAMLQTQPPANNERWTCIYSEEGAQGQLDVTRWLDAEGRALYDYVRWSPRPHFGTSAVQWERRDPVGSAVLPWTLRGDAVVVQLGLDRAARRPVWLVLRLDGRVAARRLLLREESDQADEVNAVFRTDPPGPGPVPDFGSAGEIVLTAEEEGGATLGRETFRLPGRDRMAAAIERAAPALDTAAASYRTRCQEIGAPPRIEVAPAPLAR